MYNLIPLVICWSFDNKVQRTVLEYIAEILMKRLFAQQSDLFSKYHNLASLLVISSYPSKQPVHSDIFIIQWQSNFLELSSFVETFHFIINTSCLGSTSGHSLIQVGRNFEKQRFSQKARTCLGVPLRQTCRKWMSVLVWFLKLRRDNEHVLWCHY